MKRTFRITISSNETLSSPIGACFMSKDMKHLYRQENDHVLHINMEKDPPEFLINTLQEGYIRTYQYDLVELHEADFAAVLNEVKELVAAL